MPRSRARRPVSLALAWLLLFSFWHGAVAGHRTRQRGRSSPPVVAFCDLIRNPEKYASKEVTTRATYSYGFEWQKIYCLGCDEGVKTWLEFEEEMEAGSNAALRKAPKDTGTINAVFTGTFRATGGPYGDGSYRFQFTARRVSHVEVVLKDGRAPVQMPAHARKKLCADRPR